MSSSQQSSSSSEISPSSAQSAEAVQSAQAPHPCPSIPTVWLNGRFLQANEASISPLDRGFLYGDGVFETMRAEKGALLYLRDHLERLRNSLDALRIAADLSFGPGNILRELLRRNGLEEEIASVKIIISRGICPTLGLPATPAATILLTAQKYVPPTSDTYHRGWRLHVFRKGFSPPLAAHKTLNYLYFLTARQAALDAGADEAVLLDPSGKVTETSAGSLLARTNGVWWTPRSSYQLPGITVRQISKLLSKKGNRVEEREATIEELLSAQTVWALNSLMAIMPASHIAGHQVPEMSADEASALRRIFIQKGVIS